MTDKEFEDLKQKLVDYDRWGQELKDISKKWRTKHQAVYFAFEYPVPYLQRRVFDVLFSDLSDEQKWNELEKILPNDGHYL
ncbi:MAG: hypothetical protein E7055_21895 [Lentisphaerae bacterium]|nr:hypothetical protein [Lentisphaerota bacterium]